MLSHWELEHKESMKYRKILGIPFRKIDSKRNKSGQISQGKIKHYARRWTPNPEYIPFQAGNKTKIYHCIDCREEVCDYKSLRCRECRDKHKRCTSKTPLGIMIRASFENVEWKKKIFKRDGYKCSDCGENGSGKLIAHHVKPFKIIFQEFLNLYPMLSVINNREELYQLAIKYKQFFKPSNGKTLCKKCHKKTPSYGNKL